VVNSVTTMAGKMVMTLIFPLSASVIDSLNLRAPTTHSAIALPSRPSRSLHAPSPTANSEPRLCARNISRHCALHRIVQCRSPGRGLGCNAPPPQRMSPAQFGGRAPRCACMLFIISALCTRQCLVKLSVDRACRVAAAQRLPGPVQSADAPCQAPLGGCKDAIRAASHSVRPRLEVARMQ